MRVFFFLLWMFTTSKKNHYIFQVPCVNACQDLGSPGEAVSNPPGEAGQARGEDLDQPAAVIQVGVRQALPAAYVFSNSELERILF